MDGAGYSALPAKSVPDAALLTMQLDLRVDLLIINPLLQGAGDFIAALRRSRRDARVIGILANPLQSPQIAGLHATQARPAEFNHSTKAEWLGCIEQVLASTAHTWL